VLSRNTNYVICLDATLHNRREICLEFAKVYDVVDVSADGEKVRVLIDGRPSLGWYDSKRFKPVPKEKR